MSTFRSVSLVVCSVLLCACTSKSGPSEVETGGNTSWLSICDADSDCRGEQRCYGGLCTTACDLDPTCSVDTVAACFAPAVDSGCGAALCLPECTIDAQCAGWDAELTCSAGFCVPAACVASPVPINSADAGEVPAATETDTTSEPSPPTPSATSSDAAQTEDPTSDTTAVGPDAAPAQDLDTTPAQDFDGDAAAVLTAVESTLPRAMPEGEADNAAAEDAREFTWSAYGLENDPTQNLALSPYSISSAFAMLVAGAVGETKTEIEDALHFSTEGTEFFAAHNALQQALATRNHDETEVRHSQILKVVNDLWLERSFSVENNFVDTLGQYFGAGVSLTSFIDNPDASRLAINAKVSSDTNDLIPELIPDGKVTALTRFVLTNAIYLEAHWVNTFDKDSTLDAPFAGAIETVNVPMMARLMPFVEYVETEAYQAVALPFEGYELEFVAILPKGDFAAFSAGLDAASIQAILDGMDTSDVQFSMPRFSVQRNIGLIPDLMKLGMNRAFSLETADFSGISTTPLYVQEVFHDAHVLVDEDGVQAAGATAIVGGAGSAPPESEATMALDRPFVYLIRDVDSGVNLFVGHYVQPPA